MDATVPLALNEPQQRRLTVSLASLEKHLAALRLRLEGGPAKMRLSHYEDRIAADEAAALLPALRNAEARLRKIADDLALPAQAESVRRTILAALELANIHLYECRPTGGLAGCGAVAPATADYLQREIPKLEASVQRVLQRLTIPLAGDQRPAHA